MFPTLASLLEARMIDDPALTMAVLHAFNEWLYDEWKYDYHSRVFATPIVNPAILDEGIKELELLLERGAKAVLLRPAPVAGFRSPRSPFLPEFDPFWARVQESGVLVCLHSSDSGYQEYANDWIGIKGEYLAFKPSTFGMAASEGRAISDAFYSAICDGMLTRFPGVRLASVENGGSWVEPALKTLDHVYAKMPQEFAEHPRDVFLRNVWVNPFWEDSLEHLIEVVGPEHVIFGSDYPHPEGLADPISWSDELSNKHSQDEVRQMMGGNMYKLLGVTPPR
jgi:predicted TIM-barrel fold metal-dependent hydrolase